jgi:hypothetical protein
MKDTAGVLMQQGRVLLDQDWNEYVQLQDRRWRAETMDIMGRAVVPADAPGFELKFIAGKLTIGIGRMYVDGLLAENHGIDPADSDPAKRKYDPILGEVIGKLPVPYDGQPYLLSPDPLPTGADPHAVYLDVWERELTYLEDAGLIDQAVAVDTSTRMQTVWQVKVLGDIGAVDCPAALPDSLISPSAGQLTTKAAGVPSSTDPCIVPANGGYRGSGNRCYRIEIHSGGPMGGLNGATFKWSRDNASVASAVTGINAALDTLTVVLTKRDSVLRFQPNDWVEVTDDFRYFAGLPGEMRQVAVVDDVNLTIQLKTALPAGEFDATKPERHTRVIRWNQSGIVRDPLNNVIVDVDTNGGLIPVPAAGTTVVLEDGIQITFSLDAAITSGVFKNLDYWMFSARVIDASVELLDKAPPLGIHHHFAKLGYINSTTVLSDCRIFWPPPSGECCDCTVCVSAASHNSGKLTLQDAVDQVKLKGGGKICLGPGKYFIKATVTINAGSAIEIAGHGLPVLEADTTLPTGAAMMSITNSTDITIVDVGFSGGAIPATGLGTPVPGLLLDTSSFVRVKHCLFSAAERERLLAPAIGMSTLVLDSEVRDCLFSNVDAAIARTGSATNFFCGSLLVDNNVMLCSNKGDTCAGLDFTQTGNFLGEIRLTRNFVRAALGFGLAPFGIDATIDDNTLVVIAGGRSSERAAIICGLHQCRISNNRITSDTPKFLDGPVLDGIVLTGTIYGTQITGNHITQLAGTGIFVLEGALLLETIIDQNQMLTLREAGIAMQGGGAINAIDLKITENSFAFVGLSPSENTVAVLLRTVVNADISGNFIEAVGPAVSVPTVGRAGIDIFRGIEARIAGNRIVDIGSPTQVGFSAGIRMRVGFGRLEVAGNEVRRALVPPPAPVPPATEDTSQWVALYAAQAGFATVRGNHLENFGSVPTAVLLVIGALTFSDNQCFLQNPAQSKQSPLVVEAVALGMIASNNFAEGPLVTVLATPDPDRMLLVVPDVRKDITVLGNIDNGRIIAGFPIGILQPPWDVLNRDNS